MVLVSQFYQGPPPLWWKGKIHVGVCGGVVVHEVAICLRVILQLAVIPVRGISKPHKTTHDNREFPVAPVVDLPEPGKQRRQPHRPVGRRVKLFLPCKAIRKIVGCDHCLNSVGGLVVGISRRLSHKQFGIEIGSGVGCGIFHYLAESRLPENWSITTASIAGRRWLMHAPAM